ncbi:hypothetical protein Drorol1_Dr00012644 [Drosera rotundifolia]
MRLVQVVVLGLLVGSGKLLGGWDIENTGSPPNWYQKPWLICMIQKEYAAAELCAWQRNFFHLVYLYISSQRIAGCLVAEPIRKAYKIIPCLTNRSSGSTRLKEAVSKPTKLQFGDVCFQREVSKRSPAGRSSTDSNMNFTGAMLCEEEAVRAVCGIRAIWVSPSNRRKGITIYLLDVVRRSFCDDSVLEHSQLAFSQPTSAGRALASSFAGTDSFLVYKSA